MSMGTQRTFRDLEIWQLGLTLVIKIYSATKHFPNSELYIITAQARRSALSVPSNIAEGSRRHSPLEFMRFLNIALSSLAELETQMIVSQKLGYISEDVLNELTEHIDHISRKISNLSKRIAPQNASRTTQHAVRQTQNAQQ